MWFFYIHGSYSFFFFCMSILLGFFFFFFVYEVSWFLVSGLILNEIVFGHHKFDLSILVDLNQDTILLSSEIRVIIIL